MDLPTALSALQALWNYREGSRKLSGRAESVANAEGQFHSLLNRLQGKPDAAPAEPPKTAYDRPKVLALKQQLLDLNRLAPHPRGYAFEAWLRDAFNLYRLEAREPFRNRGEQIDGSFVLQGEVYLLEAKWEASMTPAKDLHAFQGKLEQKAFWTRGLFVSYSGFTDDGLAAFGRGKRVVCMDGLDLFDTLDASCHSTTRSSGRCAAPRRLGSPSSGSATCFRVDRRPFSRARPWPPRAARGRRRRGPPRP